ncbi:hypothetical protein BLOT_006333 [Blomia tropicalis]|nr:hypothetical protein BLOT_006333 [Blomia tropicalis]
MLVPRVSQALARLVNSPNVSVQTRRTLYPHYTRLMIVHAPGTKPIPAGEKIAVYIGFLVGILGPPMYIMYDVGQKRPRE